MVDMVLDIRKGSPTLGKVIGYDMPASPAAEFGEWIWVPPGFAHGNFYSEKSKIEYLCTGEYSPGTESGISPLSSDIDWSLFDRELKVEFDGIVAHGAMMSDKDRKGLSLGGWLANEKSKNFIYDAC